MAHKRKDTLVRTQVNEYNKHMKPWGKRIQAKAERRASKKQIDDGWRLTDNINMLNGSI
jgi:hypothetical protein